MLTIIIWGTTFIFTKILLVDFQPVEILFFRFITGLLALLAVYPHRLKGTTRRQELTFAVAGLCGICLYYLMENIALIWACYSVLTKKISSFGYNTILTTRRVFFYGILFMIPALFLFDFKLELARFATPVYLLSIIYLGLGPRRCALSHGILR